MLNRLPSIVDVKPADALVWTAHVAGLRWLLGPKDCTIDDAVFVIDVEQFAGIEILHGYRRIDGALQLATLGECATVHDAMHAAEQQLAGEDLIRRLEDELEAELAASVRYGA